MRFRLFLILIACSLFVVAAVSIAAAQAPREQTNVFPPWQHGRNNDTADRGFEFTVPQVDVLADFHGDPFTAELVLYVGGNYFFAMAPLVQA
jgi:molybdate transport system substrate-binding protein